jgi:hypothetical protein
VWCETSDWGYETILRTSRSNYYRVFTYVSTPDFVGNLKFTFVNEPLVLLGPDGLLKLLRFCGVLSTRNPSDYEVFRPVFMMISPDVQTKGCRAQERRLNESLEELSEETEPPNLPALSLCSMSKASMEGRKSIIY